MNIYTDGKKHKSDAFLTRKLRDEEVKELQEKGWTVKVGVNTYPDPEISSVHWYEAVK